MLTAQIQAHIAVDVLNLVKQESDEWTIIPVIELTAEIMHNGETAFKRCVEKTKAKQGVDMEVSLKETCERLFKSTKIWLSNKYQWKATHGLDLSILQVILHIYIYIYIYISNDLNRNFNIAYYLNEEDRDVDVFNAYLMHRERF